MHHCIQNSIETFQRSWVSIKQHGIEDNPIYLMDNPGLIGKDSFVYTLFQR